MDETELDKKLEEVEKKLDEEFGGKFDERLDEEAAREELYRELEKGIKSLDEGKCFTEEEVYKALEKI